MIRARRHPVIREQLDKLARAVRVTPLEFTSPFIVDPVQKYVDIPAI
jgi:hypothetical protein